jgi:hypothetical protein
MKDALSLYYLNIAEVRSSGTSNGKKRYACNNPSCSHKNITIRVETDEMWSLYHDKKHQIWLWRAIDHGSGAVMVLFVWEEGA